MSDVELEFSFSWTSSEPVCFSHFDVRALGAGDQGNGAGRAAETGQGRRHGTEDLHGPRRVPSGGHARLHPLLPARRDEPGAADE